MRFYPFFLTFLIFISCIPLSGSVNDYDVENIIKVPETLWNKSFGGCGNDFYRAISIGVDGGVFVSGYHNSDFNLVSKYNSTGDFNWNKTWTNLSLPAWSITVDNYENVYVGVSSSTNGAFLLSYKTNGELNYSNKLNDGAPKSIRYNNESIFIGGGSLFSDDTFLARYNTSGYQMWNRTWDGGSNTMINGITLSPDDKTVYATGIIGSGPFDILTMAYSINGTLLWNRTWGGSSGDAGLNIATDTNDNVYVCGWTESYSKGAYDTLLLKYDSMGNFKWYKTWGGYGTDIASGIAIQNGSIYITGQYENPFSYVVLLKYDTNGNYIWNTTFGKKEGLSGLGNDIAIDEYGFIYVCGGIDNRTAPNGDAILLKYKEVEVVTPEFITILIPTIALMAIFIVVLKRNRHDS